MHCVILVRQSHAFLNCFLKKAFPINEPSIYPCHIQSIVGVGGTYRSVLGAIEIDIKFGTLGLKNHFYIIEDLHHSEILGHDFMATNNVTLDIRGKKMHIQDNIKVCNLQTNTGYARTVKGTTLPANSEVDIQVKIARVNNNDKVLLEPLSKLSNETIMDSRCLVRIKKGIAVIRMINPNNRDIHLKGNKALAVVSQVKTQNIFSLGTDSELTTYAP